MLKILITGINGSIGRALAAHLRNRQYDVHGTTRNKGDIQFHYLDLENVEKSTIPSVAYHAIIHCAAATSEKNSTKEQSSKVNVEGTRFLLDKAHKLGVNKFIYISSMSANDHNPSNYGQTKLQVEEVIKQNAQLNWVILRPSLVLNPNGSGIFNKMYEFIKSLPVIPIIGQGHKLSVIDIDDLCSVIEKSLNMESDHEKIIEVSSDRRYTLHEIVRLICNHLNRHPLQVTIPYSLAIAMAKCFKWLKNPPITLDNVYGLKYSVQANTDEMERIYAMKGKTLEQYLEGLA